ncbi:DNA-binding NarL/FixJ family response regulator/SAM-dependent methyltransferase [Actinoalloteichus hymeniacidonis]|nr:DNA-binding NarL/FixJ family response regulator/SAM-dependent methyltransferase [Actinoalloteichus hymeniacidonis]
MGVVEQLFYSSDVPPEITDQVSRLVTAETLSVEDVGPDIRTLQHAGARMLQEVCAALLKLSRKQPVVVCIDDVQFVDSSSLQLLLYLRRRMQSAPILLVLNEWEYLQTTLPLFYADLTRRRHHRIKLGPLSLDEVTDLLGESMPSVIAARLAPAYAELTGSNPMLLNALVEDYESAEATSGTERQPVVGAAFGRAVQACLHRWGSELIGVARSIAVLGAQATPVLIARLAGLTPETSGRIVDILTSAGLLRDGEFRHPAAVEAVLTGLSEEDRPLVHLFAAELLHQEGAAAPKVAHHLVAANSVDSDWAVGVLRDAAKQSLAGNQVDLAVQCLKLALANAEDEDERLEISVSLSRALWSINPSAAAIHLTGLLPALEDGRLAGQDAVTVAQHAIWNGNRATAAKTLEILLGAFGGVDPQTAAELRIAYEWVFGSAHDVFGALGTTSPPPGEDPVVDTTRMLATVWEHGGDGTAIASAEHILQSCRLGAMPLELAATAIHTLVYGGKPVQAGRWCERLAAEAARQGEVTWQAVIGALHADILFRCGDAVSAIRTANQALSRLPPRGWGVQIGYPLGILVLAATALGRHDVANEALQQQVREATFTTQWGLRYLHARGHHHLATGRVLAAIDDFQRCGRLMKEWSIDFPMLVPWRSGLAEANLQLGRPRVARDLVRQQLERIGPADTRTRGISLCTLAASSEPAQRGALLRQAIDCLRASGDRLALAKAVHELSRLRPGAEPDRPGAVVAAQRAEITARRLPIPAPKRPEEHRLPRASTGASSNEATGLGSLSDSERRVAELAAIGHTNREISDQLYVTVSTVEQHLTRVYRKLGVKRRTELPSATATGAMSRQTSRPDRHVPLKPERRQARARHRTPTRRDIATNHRSSHMSATSSCRICGDTVTEFIDFGKQPASDAFVKPGEEDREFFFRLAVGICGSCDMVQLMEEVPREQMFHEDYPYLSSGSSVMRAHFEGLAKRFLTTELTGEDPFIVELGSNDGTMLNTIAKAGVRHLGVEPSGGVAELAATKGIRVRKDFFEESTATAIRSEDGAADVIYAANTLCHIPYMESILRGVTTLLAPNGVFVFEDPYFAEIVERASFDQVYDEHFYFFTARSVDEMARRHGLELVDVERLAVHGGEVRYTLARPGARQRTAAVAELLASEEAAKLTSPATLTDFRERVEKNRDDLMAFLREQRAQGKRVVGYGATAKSATVTNYLGITPELVSFVCDTTPAKQGKLTPGAHLPVKPPSAFHADYPDYALLFAWNHAEEIMANEQAFREAGGKWVLYVPTVHIV